MPTLEINSSNKKPTLERGQLVQCTDENGDTFNGSVIGELGGGVVKVDVDGQPFPFHRDKVVIREVATPAAAKPAAPVAVVDPELESGVAIIEADSLPSLGEMAGELKQKHLVFPRLNLVQGVGELSEQHPPGTFLLQRLYRLLSPKATSDGQPKVTDGSLWITVLNTKLQYRENTPFDSDEPSSVVYTEEDVARAGGTTEWSGDNPPSWDEEAVCLLLIRSEDDEVAQNLPLRFEDSAYALALITFKRTSFSCYRDIFTHAQYRLRAGLHTGAWQLSARREKRGENFVWIPKLSPDGENSPELIKFIESSLS